VGLEPNQLQMSGGHLLAAGPDGGNTIIFAEGKNAIKSRLVGGCFQIYRIDDKIRQDVLFYLVNMGRGT